jgi:DNA ligase-1
LAAEEVFITGYLKNHLGWLAAMKTENRLKPVGIIEHGASPTESRAFYQVAQSLITNEDRHTVYLEPAIRAKVKFRNWTHHDMLRTPVFQAFVV